MQSRQESQDQVWYCGQSFQCASRSTVAMRTSQSSCEQLPLTALTIKSQLDRAPHQYMVTKPRCVSAKRIDGSTCVDGCLVNRLCARRFTCAPSTCLPVLNRLPSELILATLTLLCLSFQTHAVYLRQGTQSHRSIIFYTYYKTHFQTTP